MDIIETQRLILRTWHDDDAEIFAKINQDPKVIEFLRGPMSLEEAKTFMEGTNRHINAHGFGLFAATLKETKQLIGFIGLNIPGFEAPFTPCVEIGWRLAHQYWGKGYAHEGAKAVLKFGFEKFDLKEIVAFTAINNIRSTRVMEKIGMQRDLEGDFAHPKIATDHKLSQHMLYRISRGSFYASDEEKISDV